MMDPAPDPLDAEGPDMYDASIDLFQRIRLGLGLAKDKADNLDIQIAGFYPLVSSAPLGNPLVSSAPLGNPLVSSAPLGNGAVFGGTRGNVEKTCKYVLESDAKTYYALCHYKPDTITYKQAIEDGFVTVEESRRRLAIAMGLMHRESSRVVATGEGNEISKRVLKMNYGFMCTKYMNNIREKVNLDKEVAPGRSVRVCLETLEYILKDRIPRINSLPTILIHNDFQVKNILFDKKNQSKLTVIDIDTAVIACRSWDFLFLLLGSDQCEFYTSSAADILSKLKDSLEIYVKACKTPLTEEEIFLLPNILQIRLAHIASFFAYNIARNDSFFMKILEAWFLVFEEREAIRSSAKRANESIEK